MATTIIKEGQRIVDTVLNRKIANIVLSQGKEYIDEADIEGNQYLVAY
ncbi:cache domain-containing protein [Heliophilum fasciatum]|uniref:Single cache domain-containing protein n=1 Tax=Heliophilum fasciatum TaxID=35700 RepID=A0A4R2RWA4_9FIRM|nr:cache domain-containing protein [Heliophilum fasciatum]TCP68732.1 single cache domain-containing protein [Heliophilum fasciatum]